jgi:hypothetical protein
MPADGIKIDLETDKGYSGLGDICSLAWLAEGCARERQPLTFHRKRNLELMALFGLVVDRSPVGFASTQFTRVN